MLMRSAIPPQSFSTTPAPYAASHAPPPIGHNGMSRDDWITMIMGDGHRPPAVTRISQHIALVIFHIADPTTNTTQKSLRDLERITGWGRQTILDHLAELEVYIKVTFGKGRAKAIFEMTGVFTEARSVLLGGELNGVSSQPDTRMDTKMDTKVCGQPDGHKNGVQQTVVASQMDTNCCGQPDGHKNIVQPDTNVCGQPDGHKVGVNDVLVASQMDTKPDLGGDKGGGLRLLKFDNANEAKQGTSQEAEPNPRKVAKPVEPQPIPATVFEPDHPDDLIPPSAEDVALELADRPIIGRENPDGSFTGLAFRLSAAEAATLRRSFPNLSWPADFVQADATLARSFAAEEIDTGRIAKKTERASRFTQYLFAANRKAAERKAAELATSGSKNNSKGTGGQAWAAMMAVPEGAMAEFADRAKWVDGKLVLNAAERADWLPKFGNEPDMVDMMLLEITALIDPSSQMPLLPQVRKHLSRKWQDRKNSDERYLKAVKERKSMPYPGKPSNGMATQGGYGYTSHKVSPDALKEAPRPAPKKRPLSDVPPSTEPRRDWREATKPKAD